MMKNKLKYIFLFFLFVEVSAYAQTDKLKIRMDRAVEIAFRSDQIHSEKMQLKNEDISAKDAIYKIFDQEEFKGYAYTGVAPSKERDFDYMVIFDPDLKITEVKVLIYRESHGREITTPRWLQQFIGKTPSETQMKLGENVDAISGATISARSMTHAMNKVLKTMGNLRAKNIL